MVQFDQNEDNRNVYIKEVTWSYVMLSERISSLYILLPIKSQKFMSKLSKLLY